MTSSRGGRSLSPTTVMVLIGSVIALLWAGAMLTSLGQMVYAYSFFFTEFFSGVIALVALSLTVMMGLLATDRLVLKIPHRVLLQSAHRATGIIGVGGLIFHVITKIAIGRAGVTDIFVPFVGGWGLYVGLGTVASFLMVSVLWTGLIRVRFAGAGPRWLWRALHSGAYVAWPFALLHGLNAGRVAATWVTLSYLACVLFVVVALIVRLSVTLGQRSREQSQAAALNKAITGKAGDEGLGRNLLANLTGRKGDSRERKDRGKGRDRAAGWSDTTTGSWSTTGGTARRQDPDRFAVPVVPEPGTLRESVRRRDEEYAPAARTEERVRRDDDRPRRRVDDDTELFDRVTDERGSRRRRTEEDLEPTSRRRDEDDSPRRRVDEDDLAPVARRDSERPSRRRRAADDGEVVSRRSSRPRVEARQRYSAPPAADLPEEPWDSPSRWEKIDPISADPISSAPRDPISSAPRSGSGRHSVEDEVPEEVPDYWRPPGRYVPDDDLPTDDTPTLVDLASRRKQRASGDSRSKGRRRADADAVDGAYWAGLRGEAK
ncbi:hypothetical protein [Micromonospora sp. SH-82]|uniref:ferric reductase-like transmembrane domain-containing protein n=1 Tax=Micromonospora sp. SH-82 TaxID=3132938 RepID=UPI003EBBD475